MRGSLEQHADELVGGVALSPTALVEAEDFLELMKRWSSSGVNERGPGKGLAERWGRITRACKVRKRPLRWSSGGAM